MRFFGGSRDSRVADLLRPGSGLAVRRSGTTYSLLQSLGSGGGYCSQVDLVQVTGLAGAHLVNQINAIRSVVPMLSLDDTDASIVKSGTWADPNANAGAYGGTYKYTLTAGSFVTWTTPANVTRAGARVVKAINGGLAKVTIDGSATAANLLPTAQQVVDSGDYASTILIANGGTLSPTDRVLDCFASSSNFDAIVGFADGLSAGAHTVVISYLGYTHATGGATGNRVYLSGVTYATAATVLTTANVVPVQAASLGAVNSAWEFALKCLPTGATTSTFVGNIHGYEIQDSLTIAVDGATVTPTDGQLLTATTSIDITRVSHLQHPDLGATQVAAVTTVYHLDANGLRVDVTITWSIGARVDGAYAMMALSGPSTGTSCHFTKGNLVGWGGGPIDLSQTVSDTYYGASKSHAAWVWDAVTNYAALMLMPAVTDYTNGWAHSANAYTSIEDRNGQITKVYVGRVWDGNGSPETVTAGQVWKYSTRYLFGRVPSGADAVLAAA